MSAIGRSEISSHGLSVHLTLLSAKTKYAIALPFEKSKFHNLLIISVASLAIYASTCWLNCILWTLNPPCCAKYQSLLEIWPHLLPKRLLKLPSGRLRLHLMIPSKARCLSNAKWPLRQPPLPPAVYVFSFPQPHPFPLHEDCGFKMLFVPDW